ncbi:MAG TPA: 50S ribosomal protein L9 [Flavobacteriaceae bacterium]|nr:50S ribosomal protein L9 [Flavobacteriaceae bacterium]
MEVILKKDVDNLGFADDIVTVKNGYGRNYLLPRGYAVLSTPSTRKQREEMLKQRAYKEAKVIEEAKNNAKKLEGLDLKIAAKAQNDGKLFGSVSPADLSKELAKHDSEIDEKYITILGGNIKRTGQYDATLRFHREVIEDFTFEVVAEV